MLNLLREITAIDIRRIDPALLDWSNVCRGIDPKGLPTVNVDLSGLGTDNCAILSWRWDYVYGRSQNLALALKHAAEVGVKYLIVDLVSVDQSLEGEKLLAEVVRLGNLFSTLPVIAAYDTTDTPMDKLDRTLNRPWILSEARAYCQSPARVTHVGFRHGDKHRRKHSFADELSNIRLTGYADCILEILYGRVHMTNIEDFAFILAEFGEPVARCYKAFCKTDYLFAIFLLTASYESKQTVDRAGKRLDYGFRTSLADMKFDKLGFERFDLGPYLHEGVMYQSERAILLDDREVAIWRAKMTTSFDRNWIQVLPSAEEVILSAVGLTSGDIDRYRARTRFRSAFLRLDRSSPTPTVEEREAVLEEERWLKAVPRPTGTPFDRVAIRDKTVRQPF